MKKRKKERETERKYKEETVGIIKYKAAALYFSVAWIVKYNESYSKVIRKHKYKYNDKDKDTDKVPEKPNICYIF